MSRWLMDMSKILGNTLKFVGKKIVAKILTSVIESAGKILKHISNFIAKIGKTIFKFGRSVSYAFEPRFFKDMLKKPPLHVVKALNIISGVLSIAIVISQ
jgi:hypothetical protein